MEEIEAMKTYLKRRQQLGRDLEPYDLPYAVVECLATIREKRSVMKKAIRELNLR